MKVLHSAALLRPPSGIANQMRWEYEVANELGLDWDTKLYCPNGWLKSEGFIEQSPDVKAGNPYASKLLDWLKFRFGYYQWLMSKQGAYDLFLLRYYVHDPFQLAFVRCIKKPVFFVHHTLEEPELAQPRTLSSKFRASLEHHLGPLTLRHAAGIIGVTQEIIDYEISRSRSSDKPTFVYPNGINLKQEPVSDNRGNVPELLFVASGFSAWHGLDLLLDSVELSNMMFKLHLVGRVNEPDLGRAKQDPRIVLHGNLASNEIRSIAERCWVGLSSFALYRQSMQEACTLKVREYLMMGLPVYSGHKDSGLSHDFYFVGDPCIEKILAFAQEVRNASREQINSMSFSYISKKALLKKLYLDLVNSIYDAQ